VTEATKQRRQRAYDALRRRSVTPGDSARTHRDDSGDTHDSQKSVATGVITDEQVRQ